MFKVECSVFLLQDLGFKVYACFLNLIPSSPLQIQFRVQFRGCSQACFLPRSGQPGSGFKLHGWGLGIGIQVLGFIWVLGLWIELAWILGFGIWGTARA